MLAPESAAGKLKDVAAAAGAQLQTFDPSLFAAATADAQLAAAAGGGGAQQEVGGGRPASHAAAGFSGGRQAGGSDGALIIYTSGTTGRPKGALHTHGCVGAGRTAPAAASAGVFSGSAHARLPAAGTQL